MNILSLNILNSYQSTEHKMNTSLGNLIERITVYDLSCLSIRRQKFHHFIL